MKRKFNFYCILLLIAVAFSLFTAAQHLSKALTAVMPTPPLSFRTVPRARPANPTFWTCVRTTRHAANWR